MAQLQDYKVARIHLYQEPGNGLKCLEGQYLLILLLDCHQYLFQDRGENKRWTELDSHTIHKRDQAFFFFFFCVKHILLWAVRSVALKPIDAG